MGKRGATGPSKAAKVAKVEPTPLDYVLDAIKADSSLCAALPLALAAPPGERHQFQQTVLEAVTKMLSDRAAADKEALEGVERAHAAIDADRVGLEAALATAQAVEAEKASLKDAKEGDLKAAEEAVKQRLLGVETAKAVAREAEEAHKARQAILGEFEAAEAELWAPLRSWVAGSHWRERAKLLQRLLKQLDAAGIPDCLAAALEASLKIKAEARGSFANITIEHAEKAHAQHILLLKQQVDELAADMQSKANHVEQAASSAQGAEAARNAAIDETVQAQNVWVDCTSATAAATSELGAFGALAAQRTAALESAKENLAATTKIIETFDALRAGPAPEAVPQAAPAAAPEAAPEVAPEVAPQAAPETAPEAAPEAALAPVPVPAADGAAAAAPVPQTEPAPEKVAAAVEATPAEQIAMAATAGA